tara:strand:- start:46 stop:252 length:207 start_codon:yes stop_codon:yes gene_type:complete
MLDIHVVSIKKNIEMNTEKITIKLNKKDIKAIYETENYLRSVKSDLLETVLGKITFQLDKRINDNRKN